MKHLLIYLFCFCYILLMKPLSLFGQQNKADSLTALVSKSKNDTNRVNLLNKLVFELRNSNIDQARIYAEEANSLATKLNFTKGLAESYGYLGLIFYRYGEYDLALNNHFKSLKIAEKYNYKQLISFRLNDVANVFQQQKQFEKAIEYYLKSIDIKKKINDLEGIATSYNNISNVYTQQNKLDTAKAYINEAIVMAEKSKNKRVLSVSFENLAEIYSQQQNYEEALVYFEKSKKLRVEINNIFGYTRCLNGIAKIELKLKHYKTALKIFSEALDSAKKFRLRKEKQTAYYGIAQTYEDLINFEKAYQFHKLYSIVKDSLFNESVNEKLAQQQVRFDFEKKQAEIALLSKDKEIQDNRIKHQNTLIIFIAIGLLGLIILAIFQFSNNRYRKKVNKILTEQKNELLEKHEEIHQQNEEIMAQRDELESMVEIIEKRSVELETAYNTIKDKSYKITSSIVYAKRIQSALLKSEEIAKTAFADYFILFKPKDIVSGDFYWFSKTDKHVMVVTADCTGHGVPGAFMSMLGISLLNEIVIRFEQTTPANILGELRRQIKRVLGQNGQNDEPKDGMDMSFCMLDLTTNIMHFAGAYNPVWIVRNHEINFNRFNNNTEAWQSGTSLFDFDARNSFKIQSTNIQSIINNSTISKNTFSNQGNTNYEPAKMRITPKFASQALTQSSTLFEIKGDKMPIGINPNDHNPFTNHEFQLQKNDAFYIFSDGYQDQLGEKYDRKFLAKFLKELLISINQHSMSDQKQIMDTTIEEWRGAKYEQVDDILVLGIRI